MWSLISCEAKIYGLRSFKKMVPHTFQNARNRIFLSYALFPELQTLYSLINTIR